MSESAHLNTKVEQSGDVTLVTLEGSITERVSFADLLEIEAQKVDVDLCGVKRFTSAGVRLWVNFIRDLSESRTVRIVRASVAMVRQVNMIANMIGKAQIASIMVPYQCGECDQETEVPLELNPDGSTDIESNVPCPECKTPMDFDDLVDSYLAFYKD